MSIKEDPRVKRTKELFKKALVDLMNEKDFNKITVQEIAKKSTLNRATFYLHYYDKEDLLQQLLQKLIAELKKGLEVVNPESDYISYEPHAKFTLLFEKVMTHSKLYKVILVEEKMPFFVNEVYKIILNFITESGNVLQEDGIVYKVPVDIAYAYVASAYLGVITWWLEEDMPYTPKYMSKQLTLVSTVGPYNKNPFI